MLRVRSSALAVDEGGRLRLAGDLFSGLAYRVDATGVVLALDVVDDGLRTGDSNDLLAMPADGVRVDFSSLEMAGDYGPYLWQGEPVTGVVHTFDHRGACTIEQAYGDGQPDDESRRAWYPSGARWQLVEGEEGRTWFEDGRLQAWGVDGTTFLNLIVRDDGRLGGINLGDATLLDLASLQDRPLSAELFLIGRGIDTRLLATLRHLTALAAVPRLRLIKTAIDASAIDLLAGMAGLESLWLQRNAALTAHDADRLRALRPGMAVEFEAPGEDDD